MIAEGYYEEDALTPVPLDEYDETRHLASFPKPLPYADAERPMNASVTPQLAPFSGPHWQPRMGYGTTPPPVSPRAELLREAEELITGDRNETYGTPTQNFANIAGLWNIQFGHMLKPGVTFTGAHVAQAQIHVKQARSIRQPKRDNYVDIAGYAACGWEAQANES